MSLYIFFVILNIGCVVIAKSQTGYMGSVDFESSTPGLFMESHPSDSSLWNICKNTKTVFFPDSFVSPPNVIMTDSLSPYPVSTEDYFYLGSTFTDSFTFSRYRFIGFYQVDTDSGKDFGTIEVSFDNRSTWFDLLADSMLLNNGFVTLPQCCKADLTGSTPSVKFQVFEIFFQGFSSLVGTPSDTMWFRFGFHSDSNFDNKGGLVFDEFFLQQTILVSSNSTTIKKSHVLSLHPNPSRGSFTIELPASFSLDGLNIQVYESTGKLVYSEITQSRKTDVHLDVDASGLYLVRCISQEGILQKKVLVHPR